MEVTVQACLCVDIPDAWQSHMNQVTDEWVVFKGDKQQTVYRLVSFQVWGECYRICTNRFDLKTHEIIMLYAYRWQIELFFRCLKRCFKGLNLWAQDAKGIETQFYVYMIVYLLLLHFKQTSHEAVTQEEQASVASNTATHPQRSDSPEIVNRSNTRKPTRTPARGIVTLLGEGLKKLWKIGIHWLIAIRNNLFLPCDLERMRLLNSV